MNLNRSLLNEPLPWFLLIGLLIFLADGWLASSNSQQYRIQITPGQVQSLVSKWQGQMGRSPSAQELRGLMEDQIREEVLYREALKLNLDENDTIIRRRLAQKMTFLMEDTVTDLPVTDEILQAYFDAHSEHYRDPERLTFVHVYYRKSEEGSSKKASQELLQLNNAADPNQMGDPFMLRKSYGNAGRPEIERLFGRQFAASLLELSSSDQWQGPIESAYGYHLVLLQQKKVSHIPQLIQVRDKVLADYLGTERKRLNDEKYQALRTNYEVMLPP